MPIRLGVNIDHVATLRNLRKASYPKPIDAARIVQLSGADQVTIHLREDRRHINEKDVISIIKEINIDINLEIAPTSEMIDFAIKNNPEYVCLVPESRQELTTEGGLNLDLEVLHNKIKKLLDHGIKVCLFLDPRIENIEKTKILNVNYIELHTGNYANSNKSDLKKEIELIKNCALTAKTMNINCHAGHGLTKENVIPIAEIKEIKELNIGHSIICDSLFNGLENSIKEMIKIINDCRK